MQFVVKRDVLLRSLNFVQGIVEKKNTLPILSNVLLELKNNSLSIVATDLDIIFYDKITDVKILTEGSTTTSAAILYDILRKISSNADLNFELISNNKLSLKSENSNFNLLCLTTDNFPSFSNDFDSVDVMELNESPSSSVRLSASTLEELFKETKYNLKEIRKTKIVKPVEIGLLPKEIKKIESTQKRKDLFIKIVLPLILEENNRILLDRKRLFVILNKSINTNSEKEWLKKKLKQYGVVNNDLSTLKVRMDIVPVSLAIAQAAKETGWGTSRFALEGNALFGQWTWSDDGIKPASADSDSKHKVMKFKVLKASVRAYQRNLNTHSSYREFRKLRAIQRDNQGNLNSLELVKYLDEYAETGVKYTEILKKIIEQNKLTDFDKASILPTSKKLKSLI